MICEAGNQEKKNGDMFSGNKLDSGFLRTIGQVCETDGIFGKDLIYG
jgi:hypothetical protein